MIKLKQKWKNQRLWVKLTFMVLITVALTVSVLYLSLTNRIYEATQTQEEEQLLSIAEIVAAQPLVIQTLSNGATNPEVQTYANQITETYQLDFVVVMTMDRIRLTHPDPEKINAPFQGGDEEDALSGQETTSIAQGTLGQSLRAFVPVFNAENVEIGVVAIGIKTTTLASIAKKTMQPFSISFAVSLLFGVAAAIFTAFQLKTQMYNLEPIEIARLLEERNAMLENTKDAILVTDRAFAGADTLATSFALAAAIRKINAEQHVDLVFTGKQTIDGDTAQVGPGIAKRLGWNLLTYVSAINQLDLDGRTVTVERRV